LKIDQIFVDRNVFGQNVVGGVVVGRRVVVGKENGAEKCGEMVEPGKVLLVGQNILIILKLFIYQTKHLMQMKEFL
jgi:hypothetical protein